ncbi:pentapeptide repeat-containing protein [Nocardia panacis]|nr:pentapeptide repeat-containing protein [Nocardia panacis]
MPLLSAVLLAISGGSAIVAGAMWLLGYAIHTSSKPADPIDITKLSLTIAGSVGAVVALVIAYRRQRDTEQGRFIERFGAAAAQLGANQASVRIAGVYAMAVLADETAGSQRQQCIDVLCGYLRLPYDPQRAANHQTKRIRKAKEPSSDNDTDVEDHFEYLQNDKEVRQTILRVIADRVRNGAHISWSDNTFDFRAAQLEDVEFRQANFVGDILFHGAIFTGNTSFDGATFSRNTEFSGASFLGDVMFDDTTFCGEALFYEATFASHITFSDASFADYTMFADLTLPGLAMFSGTRFAGDIVFSGTIFAKHAAFDGALFEGHADFGDTRFANYAVFRDTTFAGDATFHCASFSGSVSFKGTTFSAGANFDNTSFSGEAIFTNASWSEESSFIGARFGSDAVTFDTPKRWDSAPTFDWDVDISLKPMNVKPESWPPAPASGETAPALSSESV